MMSSTKSIDVSMKKKAEAELQRTELDDQEEIEKIMSEIDQLEAKMSHRPPISEVGHGKMAPLLEERNEDPERVEESEPQDDFMKEQDPASEEVLADEPQTDEEDVMKEFRAPSGDEGGMEETLGMLGGDDTEDEDSDGGSKRPNLIDETLMESGDTAESTEMTETGDENIESENTMIETTKSMAQTSQPSLLSSTDQSPEGSLAITLVGNMTLKLKYEYVGKEVLVSFDDQMLKVALADGSEFKIPLGKTPALGVNRPHLKRVS